MPHYNKGNDILNNIYQYFLKILERKIKEKDFVKKLMDVMKIDIKHYDKTISIEELESSLYEYKNKKININEYENIQILLVGNPQMVFKLGMEIARNNVNIEINIQDFCLGQNLLIVELINETLKECKISRRITLNNLLSDSEIKNNSVNFDKTICIGDSNTYNALKKQISDIELYPYNIIDLYCSTDEFEKLQELLFDYSEQNQFEIDIYDEMELDDAIELINNGYKYCALLLSKDKIQIEKFKNEVKSEYIVVNENPFNITKFELNLD